MEEGKAAGFEAKSVDLEEFDPEVLATTRFAIFLMATYGEGEPTDNASRFYKWLKNEDESVDSQFLANLEFTVFGLGNRQYEHYNRMGKHVNELLEKLGARRSFEYGEGDDDGTLEEDFEKWKQPLWPSLRQHFHLEGKGDNSEGSTSSVPKPVSLQFLVKNLGRSLPAGYAKVNKAKQQNSTRHFWTSPAVPLSAKRELKNHDFVDPVTNERPSSEEIGSTLHLEFNLAGSGLTYRTADNLSIFPENPSGLVEAIAKALRYDLDEIIDLVPNEEDDSNDFKLMYPTPCTVRDLLTNYVDIQGKLTHGSMKSLLAYIPDANQQSWLQNLLSAENRSKFHLAIEDCRKSLVDLFCDELSSIQLPLQDFLHIAPPIQARDYTISSSSSVYPSVVHLTISITEYTTKAGKVFSGLCCGHFKRMIAGTSKVRVYVKESTFRLPRNLASPMILIGPGTGLAPMRALLQERDYLINKGTKLGKSLLFFGCKHEKMDYLYANELKEYREKGALDELYTAFSRDSHKKVYVQHLLADPMNAGELMKLVMEENGHIYVCGATAMGNDVQSAIIKLVSEYKKISMDEASTMVKKLQEKKPNQPTRYVQELWS
jgi:NADPH-ferrihemoprotein reductase